MNDNPSKRSVEHWLNSQEAVSDGIEVSIVVPAYNEEWRIPSTLIDMIDYFDQRGSSYEIIVVDDGSNDNTVQVVDKFRKIRSQLKLIRLPRNYGKGFAVRTGMLNAMGSLVLFADADGSTPIKEVERLEAAITAGADLAFGSRAKPSTETNVKSRWYRKLLGRSFSFLVNLLLLPEISDTQCGFKMFKRPVAQYLFAKQECDGFGFDLEILYIAHKSVLKLAEVPVNWVHVAGSKVNLVIDAIKMFRDIFSFKFRHRSASAKTFQSFVEQYQEPISKAVSP